MSMPSLPDGASTKGSRSRRLSRRQRVAGATLLVIGGLGSTYLQMLRSPNAEATACSPVTNES